MKTAARKLLPMSSNIDIPAKLRAAHPNLVDVSESVGGTLYGTTPGGTRIVYKREDLMQLSKSPLARSRPEGMPEVPGVTTDRSKGTAAAAASVGAVAVPSSTAAGDDAPAAVFQMDGDEE
jgi:hypothetical protein